MTSGGEFVTHDVIHQLDTSSARRHRRDVGDDASLHYHVDVEGTTLHLHLTPSDKLFAPGLIVERRQEGGQSNVTNARLERRSQNRCHFSGQIRGHPGSAVAVGTCNGLVSRNRSGLAAQ